ncbi:LytR/AlgR family response regulator transcription factor [Zunongwangia pacifica]|uniref:LytTR family DNA-binding domain-containing protein n=1 Tax=Zunongwangia pacifica TaxID=2911062 RepID=A0A9X1ZYV6_9FLAO|nr:LytTR family DNA-binding domain-containing protein [Zunongwangia pacifica]MCL6220223.1 LytTR family DNA-binding domain-containing protein [Zunongwangia pacifica]
MTKYLIIDDEHIAHEIIKDYCDLIPGLMLSKHCYDAIEALEYLRSHSVDLIFLDLNMPKLKGFDFLKSLSKPPKVIVTTAYQEHALEGYELEVIDYLLKPFSFERLLKAVNKALTVEHLNPLNIAPENRNKSDFIFLYSDKKHIQIKLDDVIYIEAAGNYSKIICTEDQLLMRVKISEMINKLPQEMFIRIHKSYIVAKRHIKTIEGNRIAVHNKHIPIGKVYKAGIDALLEK